MITLPPPGSPHGGVVVTRLILGTVLLVLAPAVALTVYMMLTSWRTTEYDVETRCRKCAYILRGITEPRCPECGEGI